MIRWLVPYPLLAAGLVGLWMLLSSPALGNLILGSAIAIVAGRSMSALEPAPPRIRSWRPMLRLFGVVMADIVRSNMLVCRQILTGERRRSGFVEIALDLRDATALAILAVIVTATPGTAWLDYDARRGVLLLHAFDLEEEQALIDLVKGRYERLLQEAFET